MTEPTDGQLTIDLGSFLPEFEEIAQQRGYEAAGDLLRQHAIRLVSDARFDAMLKGRIVVTGVEADDHGAQTLQDAARRHGVSVIVVGESKYHEGKVFRASGGFAYKGGDPEGKR